MIWYRNDYEMLLALDDTIGSHHSGASNNQIEQLPISVIQVNILLQEFFYCLYQKKCTKICPLYTSLL